MTRWRAQRTPRRGPVIVLEPDDAAQVERRREAAIALLDGEPRVARRVRDAPPGYLLTQGSADVIRHGRLLEPRPASGDIRLAVTPGLAGWHVDVAGRDRPGLMAAVTGVLAAHGLDVAQAVVATWRDGSALEAFVLERGTTPDPTLLQHDLETSLDAVPSTLPLPDAVVRFDDQVSPWYTRCDVHADDRPGVFHSLAVALASCGADVHAARARTVDGTVLDRFDLTDQSGDKLGPALEQMIRTRVREGSSAGLLGER